MIKIAGLSYLDRADARWTLNQYGDLVLMSGPVPLVLPFETVERFYGPLDLESYQCTANGPTTGARCAKWLGHSGPHATEDAMDIEEPEPDPTPAAPALTFPIPPELRTPLANVIPIPHQRPRDPDVARAMTVHCLCGSPGEHKPSCARFPARYNAAPPAGAEFCWDIDPRAFRCVLSPGHPGQHVHADPVEVHANATDAVVSAVSSAGAQLAFVGAAAARDGAARPPAAGWTYPGRGDDTMPALGLARPPAPNPRHGFAVGDNQCTSETRHPDDDDTAPEPRMVRCCGELGHEGSHAGVYEGTAGTPDAGIMQW